MPNKRAIPDERAGPRSPKKAGAPSTPDEAPARDVRTDAPTPLVSDARAADVADFDETGLTDEEIALYRRRIAEGFYNSREVAAEVARRMLRNRDR